MSFIQDFGMLFLLIVAVSFIIKLIKQPIIVGYVLSGIIFSLFLVSKTFNQDQVLVMSELGITFLLFLMGLEFDFATLKYVGKSIIVTSIMQSTIFGLIALGLSYLFGFTIIQGVYIAILFMFGSTLLVAKVLEDRKETATLHGKIIIGTLIVQDIIAIVALTALSVLQESSATKIMLAPLGAIILLIVAILMAKYLLNPLLKFSSRHTELFFIISLGVCFFFVQIAYLFGYSATIGAFIAGVTLANTIYRNEISGRLKHLIIFFNVLFFVGLGFQMKTGFDTANLLFMSVLIILCMIIKPIVTYITLRMKGYDVKTSFTSGLYLAQLSEFGIIIIAAGVFGGALQPGMNAIAIITVIITMILSAYLIKYNREIYKSFEKKLAKIDKAVLIPIETNLDAKGIEANILFFGYHDLGKEMYLKLKARNKKIVVIENDPEGIELLKHEGLDHIYHSDNYIDFFENKKFDNVELLVSNIPEVETNKLIIKRLKEENPKMIAIVMAKTLRDSIELYENDADYVIYQRYLNEQKISVLLEDYTTDINKVIEKKIEDVTKLKKIYEEKGRFKDINTFLKMLSSNKEHHTLQGESKSAKEIKKELNQRRPS